MATYYVQRCRNEENARWGAVEETDDKGWAEYLAGQLASPGLVFRVISRSKLLRTEGTRALVAAEEEVAMGMGDFERIPRMRELYAELRAEHAQAETVDFRIEDIPADLHATIKERAASERCTMNEWFIEAARLRLAAAR